MGFFSLQNQTSESDGNNKTTLEKGGRNPPDVTLDDIATDLLSFFNRFESLRKTKNNIEEKYDIKHEYGDYWSADDIKRAWGKTQRMDKKSEKRKHWAHVIILQMLKRLVYDGCKQNQVQEDHDDTTTETKKSCEKTPRMKENKDTIVNSCEQQKSIGNNEKLNFTDKPNQIIAERENEGGEDGLWSTVDVNQARGKAESMKRNPEDRSTQSSDELETVEAAGEDRKSSGANPKSSKSGLNQTSSSSQGRSGTGLPAGRKDTNDPGAPDDQSSTDDSESESEEAENHPEDESIYICIPVTEMFGTEHAPTEDDYVENNNSRYKFIDGLPSAMDIRQRKSYTMSFSNETNNAEWVYEVLNSETLEDNCKKLKPFGNVYHKGHLAAAANHRWCREANHDANFFSNIIPQHKKLNQGLWKKLENHCRRLQRNRDCNVHVYTGPLYLRKTKEGYVREVNSNKIEGKVIPTHLFKVIIVENTDGTVEEPECYVMLNKEPKSKNLDDHSGFTIEDIEKASGLTFIQRHPNANMRDCIKTVTLRGEVGNGESHNVNITLRTA